MILSVLESAVKIHTPAEVLVTKNGLISWLHRSVENLKDDVESTHSTIGVISSLWNTFSTSSESSRKKLMNTIHLPQHILLLSLKLIENCGVIKLPLPVLKKLVETLNGVICFEKTKAMCSLIDLNNMEIIVKFAKDSCGLVSDCEDLLLYGCKFAKLAKECKAGTDYEQLVFHLRSFVINWLQKMYNGQSPPPTLCTNTC